MKIVDEHLAYMARRLCESSTLKLPEFWGDRVVLAYPSRSKRGLGQVLTWEDTARRLSMEIGEGGFIPGKVGLTWQHGRGTTWVCLPSAWHEIRRARSVVAQLTELPDEEIPCSIGACGRTLLKWVGVREPWPHSADRLLVGSPWVFQMAKKGKAPQGWLWDLAGCHWALLARLPSPLFDVVRDRLVWRDLSSQASERWGRLIGAIATHKPLRNSIVGSMLGAQGCVQYVRGQAKRMPLKEGPLRPAALLIHRTAVELTAAAVDESEAIFGGSARYANKDCILSTVLDRPPKAWEYVGLRVSLVASGDLDIRGIGCYRCGEKKTKTYSNSNHVPEPLEPQFPRGRIWSRWLEAA